MIHPRTCLAIGLAVLGIAPAIHSQPRQPPDPMKAITTSFNSVHKNLLEMAEDFPADKYGFKPKPEMRSFGEVLVHVFSGTSYAAKAAVVAGFKKAIAAADATLMATPATRFAASPEPWLSVIEHSAEHYGLLVAYY